MKYYRIIILVRDGKILFSDITEHFLPDEDYQSGRWDLPITRIITKPGEFHFIAFEKNYLESMLAGIAVAQEIMEYLNETNI